MAVNKCNIVKLVADKVNLLKKGVYCGDDSAIYDNFIDYLNCDTVERDTCFPDRCSNPTVFVPCAIAISGMVREVEENMANIFMVDSAITGGYPPYTYEWTFDETEFDLVSGKYESVLVIAAKDDKDFTAIISPITVVLTDSLNCHITKTCYITPTGMECGVNYHYCPNPINLKVKNKQVYCPKPIGLIVHKKH